MCLTFFHIRLCVRISDGLFYKKDHKIIIARNLSPSFSTLPLQYVRGYIILDATARTYYNFDGTFTIRYLE